VNKTILVDARSFSDEPVGVARYVANLIKELAFLGYNIELVSNKDIVLPNLLLDLNLKCHHDKLFKFIPGSLYVFLLGFFFLVEITYSGAQIMLYQHLGLKVY
jgi:hypothetical protein